MSVRQRWGVMFQGGALFSSLCLIENVMFPMEQLPHIDEKMQKEIALLKMAMAGLGVEHENKYPAQLSGGMGTRSGTSHKESKSWVINTKVIPKVLRISITHGESVWPRYLALFKKAGIERSAIIIRCFSANAIRTGTHLKTLKAAHCCNQ